MPSQSLTTQLLESHQRGGKSSTGEEIELAVDQSLLHDVGGTMIALELEALGVDRVEPDPAVVYVDHNLLQTDPRNADDHDYLRTVAARYGMHYSPAGNGISHPVHAQLYGRPGATLLGCDSHTPGAGSLGMLAFASGGLVVALSLAGEPYRLRVPRVWGIELVGSLPEWVSAKDVVLELLRRHGVRGGNGYILEYFGEGLEGLSVMDRHVIANMGTELGATSSVFPADVQVAAFLRQQGRSKDFLPLEAEPGAHYDRREIVDLSSLVPLVALPHSPGNVVPVESVEGAPVAQVLVGSSANPGYRDLAVVANGLSQRRVSDEVTFEVNPASRQVTIDLADAGLISALVGAGARLNQSGCLGCCGMGQVPPTGAVSMRTVPRNFRGRSGLPDDRVHLCSPETALAAGITGRITDPRRLSDEWGVEHRPEESRRPHDRRELMVSEALADDSTRREVVLRRGPHMAPLPELDPLPSSLRVPVAAALGDDVSTDDIMPSGAEILAWRSNLPRTATYALRSLDPGYVNRVREGGHAEDHVIVAGANWGQGSAREHAAAALRVLGARAVIATSFARIHCQNLVAWGVLPLVAEAEEGRALLHSWAFGSTFFVDDLHGDLRRGVVQAHLGDFPVTLRSLVPPEQLDVVLAGGAIAHRRAQVTAAPGT